MKRISAAMAPIAIVLVTQFGCSPVYNRRDRMWTRDAAQLRDELSAVFAPEVAAGRMRIETRCRLALE